MFLNPYFWLFLVTTWLACLFGGYEYAQRGISEERAAAQAALTAANQRSKEISDERDRTVANISSNLASTQAKANQAAAELRDHIASGSVRLSIAGSCSSPVSSDPTTASTNNAGSCNIDPGAAQALVSLTERGDNAINKLNACIDSYNSLLEPKQ